MRTRSFLLIVLLLSSIISCGVINKSSESGPKVQTTFFGAKFGEEGQWDVMSKMRDNGIGYKTERISKTSWVASDVSFAKENWEGVIINFEDQVFCGISFSNRFSTKSEALQYQDKMRTLLEKKYPLKDSPFGQLEDVYIYHDSKKNLIYLVVMKVDEVDNKPWTCSIVYNWYKSSEIVEEKALNEI